MNEAFSVFKDASRSLEASYAALQERIERLTAELEEKNRRVRELEQHHERNKRLIAMGEMAAKIVHEIRNPLCSIELYATMLAGELEDENHRKLAEGISSGIAGLNGILTNMLIFARPHRLNMRHISLDRAVEDSVFMVQPYADRAGAEIETSMSPAMVKVDAELLKQVFMNIIINSIQAKAKSVRIETCVRDGTAAVKIADDGEGIDPEHMERIFDPFFTTKESGTGLGLAISAKIIQAHGGVITVESRVGQGSVFTIIIPLSNSESTSQERSHGVERDEAHSCG